MPRELGGPGKAGPRLVFDRTKVTFQTAHSATIIPLDQIDHVHGGRQSGPVGFLAAAVALLLAAAAGYWYSPFGIVPVWLYALVGLVLSAALIVGYLLQRPTVVRIESGHGAISMRVQKEHEGEAAAFVRHLLATRSRYLEGVYEDDASSGGGAPAHGSASDDWEDVGPAEEQVEGAQDVTRDEES